MTASSSIRAVMVVVILAAVAGYGAWQSRLLVERSILGKDLPKDVPIMPAVVAQAISNFDGQERQAARLYRTHDGNITALQRANAHQLQKTAQDISRRQMSWTSALNILRDKIDGGNRTSNYIVGSGPSAYFATSRKFYNQEVSRFGKGMAPRLGPTPVIADFAVSEMTVAKSQILQRRIFHTVARVLYEEAPAITGAAARKFGFRQALKAPAAAIDGPIPIADIFLVVSGMYGLGAAGSDARDEIVQRMTSDVHDQLKQFDKTQADEARTALTRLYKADAKKRCEELRTVAVQAHFNVGRAEIVARCGR